MIEHNLTLAWRQLVKYRLQSAVSIVSLAIGFACFALASMWIKYETTYDGFHKDADGIYAVVEQKQKTLFHFKEQELDAWPEIAEYTIYSSLWCETANGQEVKAYERLVKDSSYLSIFHIEFTEGGNGFLYDEGQVAISDRLAKKLWGDESPIGKELATEFKILDSHQNRIVTGVFKSWGEHTNFPFELLGKHSEAVHSQMHLSRYCAMRLHPHVNVDTLNARLKEYKCIPEPYTYGGKEYLIEKNTSAKVVPITQLRHSTKPYEDTALFKVEHIYLFSYASLLLIACGLLNYLTMFINRLFIRKREIALRTVFGASEGNLVVQFLTEYGLLLVIAMFFGNYILKVSLNSFLDMAELPRDLGFIYRESLLYMSLVIVVSLLISLPPIWYFRRQSLQNSITGVDGLANYNIFRRISTGFQMGIAIFSIFCVAVMLKQLDTLRHEDIGILRENRAYQSIHGTSQVEINDICEALPAFMKQLPEVDTAFIPQCLVYPMTFFSSSSLDSEHFPQLTERMEYSSMEIDEATAQFYGMTLLQGEWPDPYRHGPYSVVVNETFARRMGWDNPIGQEIMIYNVVGVCKDVLITPTQRAEPWMYQAIDLRPKGEDSSTRYLVFKFKPGTYPVIKQKMEEFYKKNGWTYIHSTTLEEQYEMLLRSENNLQKLLYITTSVCILIALFGVWSMIMLTCEQRRKEIAIRKVFGATVKDILDMFFLEYMSLQAVAAAVAFPIGYACMKPWLEQYVVQTEISWWIYVGIFLLVALLVALCIGWRVWKTATARPADEICKG